MIVQRCKGRLVPIREGIGQNLPCWECSETNIGDISAGKNYKPTLAAWLFLLFFDEISARHPKVWFLWGKDQLEIWVDDMKHFASLTSITREKQR
jgi:hypothetical protein